MSRPDVPLLVQAAYYLIGGMWPVAHVRSFEAVTGPKPDRFVVESAGMLFSAAGLALAAAAATGRDRSSRVLSAALPAASATMAYRHRADIRRTYHADAAAQALLALWVHRSGRADRPHSATATSV